MLTIDIPYAQPQGAPILLVAQAHNAQEELYGSVGVCAVRPKANQMDVQREKEGFYSLSPRDFAANIFSVKPIDNSIDPRMVGNGYEWAEVTVLQAPKHGTLSKDLSPSKNINYNPESNFEGNDTVVFLVNIDGNKIKVVYFIKVRNLPNLNTESFQSGYCAEPGWWKISSTPNTPSIHTIADWQQSTALNSLLANPSASRAGLRPYPTQHMRRMLRNLTTVLNLPITHS